MNKTLDTIVSRVERYTNTMVAGAWTKRKGENFQPTNMAGGVVYEYETAPPTQLQIAPVPNFVFNFVGLLNSFIAEQGMSMVGGSLPKGVKAAQAIDAVKAQEVANMKIMDDQMKIFIKRWSETMLDLADDYFAKPQEIAFIEKGTPTHFDVVGQTAYDKMKDLEIPGTDKLVPLSRKYMVDIKVEAGLGYTPEAKKAAALQLANFMQAMLHDQVIQPQVMQQFIANLLEAYQFGNTQEFMELVQTSSQNQVPPQMLDQIKLAVAQVMQDMMKAQTGQPPQGGPQQPQQGPPQPQGQPTAAVATNPQAPQGINPNQMNHPMNMSPQGNLPNAK